MKLTPYNYLCKQIKTNLFKKQIYNFKNVENERHSTQSIPKGP